MVLDEMWEYSEDRADPQPLIRTTSNLSNILEAAKARVAERDNQSAALPDLLDVLKDLHSRNRLIPEEVSKASAAPNSIEDVLTAKLNELRDFLEQGFRWNVQHRKGKDRPPIRAMREATAGVEYSSPGLLAAASPEPQTGESDIPFKLALALFIGVDSDLGGGCCSPPNRQPTPRAPAFGA